MVDANAVLLTAAKAMYAALHLEHATLGQLALLFQWNFWALTVTSTVAIQIVMCVFGLYRYKATTASRDRILRRPYLLLSVIILALFSYASATDSIYFAEMVINKPYGDLAIFFEAATPLYGVIGGACNSVVILIGDGVLVSTL